MTLQFILTDTDQGVARLTLNRPEVLDSIDGRMAGELREGSRSGRRLGRVPDRAEGQLNGFGVCHGGIPYLLADSALAFASNTHGTVTVSIQNGISYPAPVHEGDILTAVAEEQSAGNRVAFYQVTVTNQAGVKVGLFTGTVYRTSKPLDPDDSSRPDDR